MKKKLDYCKKTREKLQKMSLEMTGKVTSYDDNVNGEVSYEYTEDELVICKMYA